ncbi:hypothetical protein E3U43_018899 [Larimichthys crocea]|uniref:Uncharacterized protein n=1 Tax=Larimichthys crocea TaxID=215358 RepID=A0ACD3QWJ6_LARCR|nr:hypothetical protein E3U43_018899 [Larimichthys crocea]
MDPPFKPHGSQAGRSRESTAAHWLDYERDAGWGDGACIALNESQLCQKDEGVDDWGSLVDVLLSQTINLNMHLEMVIKDDLCCADDVTVWVKLFKCVSHNGSCLSTLSRTEKGLLQIESRNKFLDIDYVSVYHRLCQMSSVL